MRGRGDPGSGAMLIEPPGEPFVAKHTGGPARPCGRGDARPPPLRGNVDPVAYSVRAARSTDIDRLLALSERALAAPSLAHPLDAADLLVQLVYSARASVIVVEALHKVVGGLVLVLRPSVRAAGHIATVDLLVADPGYEVDQITDLLLAEVLRTAAHRGCALVEAARPADPVELARWQRHGFSEAEPRMERTVIGSGDEREVGGAR